MNFLTILFLFQVSFLPQESPVVLDNGNFEMMNSIVKSNIECELEFGDFVELKGKLITTAQLETEVVINPIKVDVPIELSIGGDYMELFWCYNYMYNFTNNRDDSYNEIGFRFEGKW